MHPFLVTFTAGSFLVLQQLQHLFSDKRSGSVFYFCNHVTLKKKKKFYPKLNVLVWHHFTEHRTISGQLLSVRELRFPRKRQKLSSMDPDHPVWCLFSLWQSHLIMWKPKGFCAEGHVCAVDKLFIPTSFLLWSQIISLDCFPFPQK